MEPRCLAGTTCFTQKPGPIGRDRAGLSQELVPALPLKGGGDLFHTTQGSQDCQHKGAIRRRGACVSSVNASALLRSKHTGREGGKGGEDPCNNPLSIRVVNESIRTKVLHGRYTNFTPSIPTNSTFFPPEIPRSASSKLTPDSASTKVEFRTMDQEPIEVLWISDMRNLELIPGAWTLEAWEERVTQRIPQNRENRENPEKLVCQDLLRIGIVKMKTLEQRAVFTCRLPALLP